MVVHDQKALFVGFCDHGIDGIHIAGHIHAFAFHLFLMAYSAGVLMDSLVGSPKVVRPLGDQVQVIHLTVKTGAVLGTVKIDLDAGEHEKIRLVHMGMVYDHIMIGDGQNLIADGFVGGFYLLRGQLAVGNGAVGVQINAYISNATCLAIAFMSALFNIGFSRWY